MSLLFQPNQFYHIYNRGNNKQQIFFNRENYLYFLKKLKTCRLTYFCDIVAYCLMPNHYHILVYTNDSFSLRNPGTSASPESVAFAKKIGTLQSSYTQAINKQENRIGSLFQQKAKAKELNLNNEGAFICFNYIHQNPYVAGLSNALEDWEFSSYRDYANLRNGTLVNKTIAHQLLDIPENPDWFRKMSLKVISNDKIRNIFQ